ncbi:MAG TPA: phosphate ABC transporter permease subunit PstC [Symbiobacteriaceae bacterium]|nr:phosphate ABC transporter permease subunit PstC [Symbiobacteriaceae bacterium]
MTDRLARGLLFACAVLSSAAVAVIAAFVALEGRGALSGLPGAVWSPEEGLYGVRAMLWGSLAVTGGALIIAVPAGVGMALYLTEAAPPAVASLARPMLQTLAGVPSVVYGFVGLSVLVPAIRRALGGPGFSVLAGALVLAVMVLPAVAAVAEDALRALPRAYREGAAALGATPWQTVRRVLLPAARGGITTAVVLGLGRALGETMAVLMVTGNVATTPTSPLDPARTLTGNIAMEMGYAVGRHREALFATGALLLGLVMAVNAVARRAGR